MKNTLHFEMVQDWFNNTTTYASNKVLVYRRHDTVCDIDILYINTDLENHTGVKITKTAPCIMIFKVENDELFITGLDDCESLTVKATGELKMTIKL